MTAIDDMRTQADKGRQILAELAGNAVEKIPDLIDTTDRLTARPGSGISVQPLLDHGEGSVQFPSRADVRRAWAGIQPAADAAGDVRSGARRRRSRSGGHKWRNGATLVVLGLGVGIIVNRLLVGRQRSKSLTTPGRPGTDVTSAPFLDSYHSSATESSGEGGVYHDQQECPAGQRITPEHRSSGTAGRSRCKECQSIASSAAS